MVPLLLLCLVSLYLKAHPRSFDLFQPFLSFRYFFSHIYPCFFVVSHLPVRDSQSSCPTVCGTCFSAPLTIPTVLFAHLLSRTWHPRTTRDPPTPITFCLLFDPIRSLALASRENIFLRLITTVDLDKPRRSLRFLISCSIFKDFCEPLARSTSIEFA